MKKILSDPQNVVREMCNGIRLAHPELALLDTCMVIKRKHLNPDKVALISGGGSGHEPAHAGFVGYGMLDAAVCGDVFASPSQIQVYRAIQAVAGNRGVLLIVKNYSGDVMNFQSAAYLAGEDGIEVASVKVSDDVAVEDSLYTVGRRGVAGTVFVHKIAGAAAEQGKPLAEVKALAERAAASVSSIGFALTSCTVPAKGSPTFTLAEDEMEYGVGIHGEPGIRRERVIPAQELAARLVDTLCKAQNLKNGSRAALLVNGFGATPLMELYLLNSEVRACLDARGVTVARTLVGNFMTSIDMAGASVSLLRLEADGELEALLDEACSTPGLKIDGPAASVPYSDPFARAVGAAPASYEVETPAEYARVGSALTLQNIIYIVDVMSACIIRNEVPFCELDAHAGDGDFGMSIAKGFRRLKQEWAGITGQQGLTIGRFLEDCSLVIMEHCGGASGPLWGSAFRAAGRKAGNATALDVPAFAAVLAAALAGIQDVGRRAFGRGAKVGDKTLVDALAPCVDAWQQQSGGDLVAAFRAGAEAAVAGAAHTSTIAASLGRAGTVGERSIGYPDAGAHALGVIFTEIAGALRRE